MYNSQMTAKLKAPAATAWKVCRLALRKFFDINGTERAGAFAFSAFCSLFPLILLLVSITSLFVDRELAGQAVVTHIERSIPLGPEMQNYIFSTVAGVIKARGRASAVALVVLLWMSAQFFITLIKASSRAWGGRSPDWWHLPLTSLKMFALMAAAVLLGMGLPLPLKMLKAWFPSVAAFLTGVYSAGVMVLPPLLLFAGLVMLYRLAPRPRAGFREVWQGALCATALLQGVNSLFLFYLKHFAKLNAVYGAFGGIIALLIWIYLSGCVIIFGACLSAALSETRGAARA